MDDCIAGYVVLQKDERSRLCREIVASLGSLKLAVMLFAKITCTCNKLVQKLNNTYGV